MSFNVGLSVATANHFIGLAADVARDQIASGIVDEDSRRAFWIKYMLPKLTEVFLDEVIKGTDKCVHFKLDGFDDANAPPEHILMFQSFAHLCVPLRSVSSRFVPYQFRFILSKSARPALASSLQTDNMLRKDIFDKAGWEFWITETGFCLAPQTIADELNDLAALRLAWMKTRDEYELPESFGNKGFEGFEGGGKPDPLLAHLPPVPPALVRLAASTTSPASTTPE